MSKELKPCPFCGGSVQMNVNAGMNPPYGFINCHKCNCTFTLNHTHDSNKVAAAWNRRDGERNGAGTNIRRRSERHKAL